MFPPMFSIGGRLGASRWNIGPQNCCSNSSACAPIRPSIPCTSLRAPHSLPPRLWTSHSRPKPLLWRKSWNNDQLAQDGSPIWDLKLAQPYEKRERPEDQAREIEPIDDGIDIVNEGPAPYAQQELNKRA